MTGLDGDTLLLEARVAHAREGVERVDALNALARQLAEGGSERSLTLSEEAMASAQAIGYTLGVVAALRNRASCRLVRSDYEAAEADYREALALAQSEGWASLEAACLLGLSTLRRKELDYDAAEALLLAGLERARAADDHRTEAGCWNNLSALHRELGRYAEAIDAARHGADAATRAGDRSAILFCRANALVAQCESGALRDGVAELETCLREVEEAGHHYLRAHLLGELSGAYLKSNRVEEALQANEAALRLARTHRDAQLEMLLLLTLGHILEALGLPAPADTAFEGAIQRALQTRDQEVLLRAVADRGRFQERRGALTEARALFIRWEELAVESGAERHQREAAEAQGRIDRAELSLLQRRLDQNAPEDAQRADDPQQSPEHGGDTGGVLEVHRIGRGG